MSAIDRIAHALREFEAGLRELMAADEWIDQAASPLGRREHCRLARTGAFEARKVGSRWLAKRSALDAYIAKAGKRPVANDADEEAKAMRAIEEFRAPTKRRAG